MDDEGTIRKVLLVDDDVAVTNHLMVFLVQTGMFEPTVMNDSTAVPDLLKREDFDVMLLDIDMPGLTGIDVLKKMREMGVYVPVVVLSGVNDAELAVKSLKLGAFDYLTKPVENDHLVEILESAMKHHALHAEIKHLPEELSRDSLEEKEAFVDLPTVDPAMIRVLHEAEKMAGGDLSIFIIGEGGTERESLARAIHNASPRKENTFVSINASEIPEDEFAGRFFGRAAHWRGDHGEIKGFLDESARGTIFIDHAQHLSIPSQKRILRVIQKGEFYREGSTKTEKIDTRCIMGSTRDLTTAEYREKFSRDLLYHMMVNSLFIPPLRERKHDIEPLAQYFLKKEVERTGKKITGFSDEFMKILKNYDFPYNIKELRNVVASCVVNSGSGIISPDSLSSSLRRIIVETRENS